MGKVKEILSEDMMVNPDRYVDNDGRTWDEYIPEIIDSCKRFNIPVSDEIKGVKEELAMKNDW